MDKSYLGNFQYAIGPSADWVVKGLIKNWCDANPMPEQFDENDSWHWALMEMHDLLDQLTKKG